MLIAFVTKERVILGGPQFLKGEPLFNEGFFMKKISVAQLIVTDIKIPYANLTNHIIYRSNNVNIKMSHRRLVISLTIVKLFNRP